MVWPLHCTSPYGKTLTARKMSGHGVFLEIYGVYLRIHFKYGQIRTIKNSVFGHFYAVNKIQNTINQKQQLGKHFHISIIKIVVVKT